MSLRIRPAPWQQEGPLQWIYPLEGMLLSITSVVGFLTLRCARAQAPLSLAWITAELRSDGDTYAYLAISTMLLLVILGGILGRREDQLLATAITDPGTCLSNRRHFEQRLPRELACASHCGSPLSLLMVDVDRLKLINDRLGHEAGDAALQLVAESLRRTCRSRDLAARWGGDEFVVLVPGTTADQALILAGRIRAALRQLVSWPEALVSEVSVSIGISDLDLVGSPSPDELFASADRALYLAKQQGRDRAFVARAAWVRRAKSIEGVRKEEHADVHA